MIICNTRILNTSLTGVQRVTVELLKRMPEVREVKPEKRLPGPVGHLWEQAVLPVKVGRGTLWSPSNTGPLAVKRQVVTVHDLATLECPEGYSRGFRAYYNGLFPYLLPRVPGIISVSEYTKERIIHHYKIPAERIHVTPLGIDHDRFMPPTLADVDAVKAKLGLPERYVLFLGALSGRKNVKSLIEAWGKIQDSVGKDTGLVIAGAAGAAHVFDGQAMPVLPPRTVLTGRIDDNDLSALLGGATVFVMPSVYEGFGLPPLEAMACGTPCLVSDRTSLPEVVGDAALLTDPTDIDDMAEKLHGLLGDAGLRKTLAAAGLKRAKLFTWDACAQQTLSILKSV